MASSNRKGPSQREGHQKASPFTTKRHRSETATSSNSKPVVPSNSKTTASAGKTQSKTLVGKTGNTARIGFSSDCFPSPSKIPKAFVDRDRGRHSFRSSSVRVQGAPPSPKHESSDSRSRSQECLSKPTSSPKGPSFLRRWIHPRPSPRTQSPVPVQEHAANGTGRFSKRSQPPTPKVPECSRPKSYPQTRAALVPRAPCADDYRAAPSAIPRSRSSSSSLSRFQTTHKTRDKTSPGSKDSKTKSQPVGKSGGRLTPAGRGGSGCPGEPETCCRMELDQAAGEDDAVAQRHNTVQEWVNSITGLAQRGGGDPGPRPQLEGMEISQCHGASSAGAATAGAASASTRTDEDDLSLGAEAKLMASGGAAVIGITGTESGSAKDPLKCQASRRQKFAAIHNDSFNSEGSRHPWDSIEALLSEREGDPEEILTNLGFAGLAKTDEFGQRVPERFLRQTSTAFGISLGVFLENNPELQQFVAAQQASQLAAGSSTGANWTSTFSSAAIPAPAVSSTLPRRFSLRGQIPFNRWNSAPAGMSSRDEKITPSSSGATPNGRRYSTILHPDNSEFLAKQGLYDAYLQTTKDKEELYSEMDDSDETPCKMRRVGSPESDRMIVNKESKPSQNLNRGLTISEGVEIESLKKYWKDPLSKKTDQIPESVPEKESTGPGPKMKSEDDQTPVDPPRFFFTPVIQQRCNIPQRFMRRSSLQLWNYNSAERSPFIQQSSITEEALAEDVEIEESNQDASERPRHRLVKQFSHNLHDELVGSAGDMAVSREKPVISVEEAENKASEVQVQENQQLLAVKGKARQQLQNMESLDSGYQSIPSQVPEPPSQSLLPAQERTEADLNENSDVVSATSHCTMPDILQDVAPQVGVYDVVSESVSAKGLSEQNMSEQTSPLGNSIGMKQFDSETRQTQTDDVDTLVGSHDTLENEEFLTVENSTLQHEISVINDNEKIDSSLSDINTYQNNCSSFVTVQEENDNIINVNDGSTHYVNNEASTVQAESLNGNNNTGQPKYNELKCAYDNKDKDGLIDPSDLKGECMLDTPEFVGTWDETEIMRIASLGDGVTSLDSLQLHTGDLIELEVLDVEEMVVVEEEERAENDNLNNSTDQVRNSVMKSKVSQDTIIEANILPQVNMSQKEDSEDAVFHLQGEASVEYLSPPVTPSVSTPRSPRSFTAPENDCLSSEVLSCDISDEPTVTTMTVRESFTLEAEVISPTGEKKIVNMNPFAKLAAKLGLGKRDLVRSKSRDTKSDINTQLENRSAELCVGGSEQTSSNQISPVSQELLVDEAVIRLRTPHALEVPPDFGFVDPSGDKASKHFVKKVTSEIGVQTEPIVWSLSEMCSSPVKTPQEVGFDDSEILEKYGKLGSNQGDCLVVFGSREGGQGCLELICMGSEDSDEVIGWDGNLTRQLGQVRPIDVVRYTHSLRHSRGKSVDLHVFQDIPGDEQSQMVGTSSGKVMYQGQGGRTPKEDYQQNLSNMPGSEEELRDVVEDLPTSQSLPPAGRSGRPDSAQSGSSGFVEGDNFEQQLSPDLAGQGVLDHVEGQEAGEVFQESGSLKYPGRRRVQSTPSQVATAYIGPNKKTRVSLSDVSQVYLTIEEGRVTDVQTPAGSDSEGEDDAVAADNVKTALDTQSMEQERQSHTLDSDSDAEECSSSQLASLELTVVPTAQGLEIAPLDEQILSRDEQGYQQKQTQLLQNARKHMSWQERRAAAQSTSQARRGGASKRESELLNIQSFGMDDAPELRGDHWATGASGVMGSQEQFNILYTLLKQPSGLQAHWVDGGGLKVQQGSLTSLPSTRQLLLEEVKLLQAALNKYKMELRALELRATTIYALQGTSTLDKTTKEDLDILSSLRGDVTAEVLELERLLSHRLRAILAGRNPGDNNTTLAGLNIVHQMVELLKEQVYHTSVVCGLDVDQQLPPDLAELHDSHDGHGPNLAAAATPALLHQMALLQQQVHAQTTQTAMELRSSLTEMKASLVSEIRRSIAVETQQFRTEVKIGDLQLDKNHQSSGQSENASGEIEDVDHVT